MLNTFFSFCMPKDHIQYLQIKTDKISTYLNHVEHMEIYAPTYSSWWSNWITFAQIPTFLHAASSHKEFFFSHETCSELEGTYKAFWECRCKGEKIYKAILTYIAFTPRAEKHYVTSGTKCQVLTIIIVGVTN